MASMTARIEQAQRALADDRLQDVVQAAHGCRNDALMVGAQPLLTALTELEDASRGDRVQDAHAAMQRLSDIWPQTRDELQRAVHGAVNSD
jgi:HPt (histidine-containing phosphotransfer) domain-containing protein